MPKQHMFAGSEMETPPETRSAASRMKADKKKEAAGGTGELIQGVGELFENPWLALVLLPAFVWGTWSKWQTRRQQR